MCVYVCAIKKKKWEKGGKKEKKHLEDQNV